MKKAGTNAAISLNGAVVGGTNVQGNFELRKVPAGTLNVSISHPDYEVYAVDEERGSAQKLDAKSF